VQQQRREATREVLTWLGTPFAHDQHVKGAGVDCLYLLLEAVGRAIGRKFIVPHYPLQWFQHVKSTHVHPEGVPHYPSDEWYLEYLKANGFVEVALGQAGDLVVSKCGEQVYCHGGLIVEWPTKVAHCTQRSGRRGAVQLVDLRRSAMFLGELKFFSWGGWHGETV
jgi:hypothetical protein